VTQQKQVELELEEAVAALTQRSSLMADFYRDYGLPRLYRDSFDPGRSGGHTEQDAFGFLVETLVYQQLSGSSARAILERLDAATGLQAEAMAVLSPEELRRIGLSGPKIKTLDRLCQSVSAAQLSRLASLDDLSVRTFIEGLYGFGSWSADMFLMFHLQRFDIWPVGDLAMRRSVQRHLSDGQPLLLPELIEHGERYRPFRSLAAWYFWADDHAQG
jgi:DNA-3-methyladenine glycosylase II